MQDLVLTNLAEKGERGWDESDYLPFSV